MARAPKHQPMTDDDEHRLISRWMKRGDTEAALVAGSLVEDRLRFAIKSHFVPLAQQGDTVKSLTEAALFDGYGPLASFFAKIDMAYALGIIDGEIRRDLHIIRSIRNDFAHAVDAISFDNPDVEKKLRRIRSVLQNFDLLKNDFKGTSKQFNKRLFLNKCAFFCGVFSGYVVGKMATHRSLP